MRSTSVNFIGLFVIASALFFPACKDPCKKVLCGENGICIEGTCQCDIGYSGTLCDNKWTTKFTGNFSLAEICSAGNDAYNCSITDSSSDATRIVFENLQNSSIPVYAIVDESGTTFTIPTQSMLAGSISGSGSTNADASVITLQYSVTIGANTNSCTSVLTRQ